MVGTNLIENILQLVLRQGTTFHILHRPQILRHPLPILLPDRLHTLLGQLIFHARIVTQICLSADDQARHARAVVVHFGEPFLTHVLEGGRRGDAEADEEDVSLRVGERAQPVIVFLAGGVEEAECVGFIANPGQGARLAV